MKKYKMTFVQSYGQDNLKQNMQEMLSACDDGTENEVINLYPQMNYQTFEGFGGALTDAAGYEFSLLDEEQREELLSQYFATDKMNYQKVRIHMDSCDFSTHMYEADGDENDEKLENFSLEDTQRYIIPLLDAAQKKAGKPLKIMLSPWSPPAYMKTNGKRKEGGSLKPEYYGRWARYLCRYIREFCRLGYEVERISLQNEPKAVQDWDSCVYTPQQEKTFLKDYMIPELKANGLGHIQVFIWDHNKERLFDRAMEILDEETEPMVSGIAFHWYSGDHFEALDMFHEKYPDKKMILSESCLEYNKFDADSQAVNANRLAHDMIGNLNHGMGSFYDWNILLNKEGGPNHVGNFCDAPYLFDEEEKKLIRRRTADFYWHFAHYIKPGAVRMGYSRYTEQIDVTAWKNPQGDYVLILLNRTDEEKTCHIRLMGQMFTCVLKPYGIFSAEIEETK